MHYANTEHQTGAALGACCARGLGLCQAVADTLHLIYIISRNKCPMLFT